MRQGRAFRQSLPVRVAAYLFVVSAAVGLCVAVAPVAVRAAMGSPAEMVPLVRLCVAVAAVFGATLVVVAAGPVERWVERVLFGTTAPGGIEQRAAGQELLVALNETLRQGADPHSSLQAALEVVRRLAPVEACLLLSAENEGEWRTYRAGTTAFPDGEALESLARRVAPALVTERCGSSGNRENEESCRLLSTVDVIRTLESSGGSAGSIAGGVQRDEQWAFFSRGSRPMGVLVLTGARSLRERPALLRSVCALFSQALGIHRTIGELTALKSYHERITDSMHGCLVVVDTKLLITTMNRAGSRFVGLPVSAVVGRPLDDVPALVPLRQVVMEALERRRTVRRAEVAAGGRPERPTVLGVSTSILTDAADQLRGVVVNFMDLSEMKQMQQQLIRSEKLASIGQLAAGISHELRNPLGSIVGYAELIQERIDTDDEVVKRGLETILSESERSKRIIESLLDYARVKKPAFQEVNFNALVMDTLPLVRHELARTEIEVQTDLQPDLAPVRADVEQMREVLINLLLNAREAMRDGGRVIRVTTGSNARNVFISVCDEGRGIAESDMERLFEPFFTTKQSGTGLGLPIVHRIVEAHRGIVQVESSPGSGSVFTVTLPRAPARFSQELSPERST